MDITLIGYGRMGKEVEKTALSQGHNILIRIDKDNEADIDSELFMNTDVAIEFTTASTAYGNIKKCLEKGIPVISGTTGWADKLEEIKEMALSRGGSFLYASNFSIGVNIMFKLNKRLASIMNGLPSYEALIHEIHHIMKKDAPSGTAISLADDIIEACEGYRSWHKDQGGAADSLAVLSTREGQVPGTHKVEWKSDIDSISLEHRAHSRKGFALGAVFAAEFIKGRKGVFTMSDVLGF